MEFRSNRDDWTPLLEESESRLGQLRARAESTQSPLVSPAELLADVKVCVWGGGKGGGGDGVCVCVGGGGGVGRWGGG